MVNEKIDGRVPQAAPGSREPSPSVSAASGFDPSRGIWDRLGDGAFRRGYVQAAVGAALGDQLGGLLRSRDMEASDLAKLAGVKRDDVIRILSGNFAGDMAVLTKIAAVFDVAVSAQFMPYSRALAEFGYVPSFNEEELRDSDGPRMAETSEDLARGEAGPARAAESGIAHPSSEPTP